MERRAGEDDKAVTDTEFARKVAGGLSDADHERLLRYYIGLKPAERIQVHMIHTEKSRKKSATFDKAHVGAHYYGTFLLAIREYMWLLSKSAGSSRMTPKKAAEIDRLRDNKERAKPPRGASEALQLVEKWFDKIKALRDNGTPWRAIAAQLSKGKKGHIISHTSLISHFNKLAHERGVE